jgi:hypothetical protein
MNIGIQVEIVKANTALLSILNRQWLRCLALLSLVLVLVAAAAGWQGRAAAESSPQLTSMAISVMPEYDQPRVLVSYRGEFDADVALPLEARLRLPADASIEHVCSIRPPNEEHICQPYSADPDGQYLSVTWEAVTPIMYVEFYYGSVSGAGQRSLDFTFWAPYRVQVLDLFVQEPMEATEFTLSPAPADTVGDQGFRHHSYSFQDVSVEEPVSIEMVYTRQTGQPSVPPRAAAAADGSSGIPQGVLLALGLAGAAVLAFVFYSVFARRFRIRFVSLSAGAPPTGEPQTDTFFCRRCGGVVKEGFAFCPSCGRETKELPGKRE